MRKSSKLNKLNSCFRRFSEWFRLGRWEEQPPGMSLSLMNTIKAYSTWQQSSSPRERLLNSCPNRRKHFFCLKIYTGKINVSAAIDLEQTYRRAGIVQWGASGGRPGWKEAGEAAAVPTLFPPSGTPRRDGAARTAGIRMAPSPGQESLASLQRLRAEPRVRAAQRSARARPRALPGTPPGTAGRGGGDASGNGGGGSPAAPGDAVGRRGGADSARRPRRGSPGSYFRLEAPGFQRRRTPAPAGRLALSDGDAAVRVGKEVCAEAGNLPGRRRLPARPRAAPRPRLLGACAGGSPGSPGGTPSGRGLADKPSVWFITRVTGLVTCVLLLASLRALPGTSGNSLTLLTLERGRSHFRSVPSLADERFNPLNGKITYPYLHLISDRRRARGPLSWKRARALDTSPSFSSQNLQNALRPERDFLGDLTTVMWAGTSGKEEEVKSPGSQLSCLPPARKGPSTSGLEPALQAWASLLAGTGPF
ncbi:uncharacterized protein LOC123387269 [Mustela putorius furo]|uniref:Uncharacterized protein LOC123387269 n=1 Tax=Mustela putorius furo TaxID=9669 RepID=A0A8U0R9S0_MUSPF|nr:uncharacterized protein LOC123387269 [Mustela putorius furo]